MSADTLIIIPTRSRVELAARAVRAIYRTAHEPVDVTLVVNEDQVELYEPVIRPLMDQNFEANGFGSVGWLNVAVADNALAYSGKLNGATDPNGLDVRTHRYIGLWNDDHEAVTPGWDVIFKDAIGRNEPFGLAWGRDGIYDEQVPTAPFLTSSWFTTLGWAVLPGLWHILADNVWMDLSKAVQAAHFCPDVLIKHHHPMDGITAKDETNLETNNNEERNQADRERWWQWLESPERVVHEQLLAHLWDPPRQITRPDSA